ncbi:hypothetical protein PtA15_7A362 [Puccinia triticina]|uniref:Uncharacterized protein n=1 Tax=Puccinia triticina TaxID=208348 RepID=A0ABY7CNM5_9BASI|nr:uncharacterized protein PtA15_7A362 [Puccinia triticina]WAQ86635.1 hypothetical protein PtA15_7A362 [Puccinia triticina]
MAMTNGCFRWSWGNGVLPKVPRSWLAETRLIFKAVDGFGQQIALKTVVQQEQKKWLNQQNLGLFWEPTQPTDPAVANTIPAL